MSVGEYQIPSKLKHDAIVEAVVEIRFDRPPKLIPEIFFGRIVENSPWKNFDQRPLPAYQIPANVRQLDQQLRYQPIFEVVEEGQPRMIRIGPQSLSYHRLSPYVGWKQFSAELNEAVDSLFETARGMVVRRLGLRYMNAWRVDPHRIGSISDLNLKLSIADQALSGNANINFTTNVTSETDCTVRIATPEFVQGPLPASSSVFVDVDVFTRDGYQTEERSVVKDWIEFAHKEEKRQFFRLLKPETIDFLKEE